MRACTCQISYIRVVPADPTRHFDKLLCTPLLLRNDHSDHILSVLHLTFVKSFARFYLRPVPKGVGDEEMN